MEHMRIPFPSTLPGPQIKPNQMLKFRHFTLSKKNKKKTVARIQFDGSLKEVRRGQQKAEKASSTKKKQLCVYLG